MIDLTSEINALRHLVESDADARIGWTCIHAPIEIIAAAGLRPVRLRPHGTTRVSADYPATDMCLYLRRLLEEALNGSTHADGIVGSSCCEGQRRFLELCRRSGTAPFCKLIDLPRVDSISARHYLTQQLKKFKTDLEKTYDVRITDRDLFRAIKDYGRLREDLRKIDRLRAERPGMLSNAEFYGLVSLAMDASVKQSMEAVRSALSKARKGRASEPSARVGVMGNNIDNLDPFVALDRLNLAVVADDLCSGGGFYRMATAAAGDPFEALADRSFSAPACSVISKTRNNWRFLNEASAGGASIIFVLTQKGCCANTPDFSLIKREAETLGMTAFSLTVDHASTDGVSSDETLERIMEMIA